jgi:hypothetical protein
MSKLSQLFLAATILVPCASLAADAPCDIPRKVYAHINMSIDEGGAVVIPAIIGGKPLQMVVDTGGVVSMLSRSDEDALGLGRRAIGGSSLQFYGKTPVTSYVHAPDMIVGLSEFPAFNIFTLPDGLVPADDDGIIAPDLLSIFDVDFDFASGKFSLFAQDHCPGTAAYWTKTVTAQIPIRITSDNQIVLTLQLDGQDVLATIDTGSSNSEMSLETAEKLFDFDLKSPLVKHDSGGGRFDRYHYPFKNLTMQNVSVQNPDLTLISDDQSGMGRPNWEFDNSTPRLILGMNILRQLHLFIAYKEKILYVTPAEQH